MEGDEIEEVKLVTNGVVARHQESRDRSPWCLRDPRDDTALTVRPLRGRGHRSTTLSQVFKTQSRSQLSCCSNGGAAITFTGQRPHRYEGGTGSEVHVRSKAPDVQGRPTQRKKRVKVQAKQSKYVKVKNEGKYIIQTELDTSEVQNCHAKPIVLTKVQIVQRIYKFIKDRQKQI